MALVITQLLYSGDIQTFFIMKSQIECSKVACGAIKSTKTEMRQKLDAAMRKRLGPKTGILLFLAGSIP